MHAAPRAASAWPSEPGVPAVIRSVVLVQRASPEGRGMIRRLLRSVDFERVLRTRTHARTEHFAVHHVSDSPSLPASARPEQVSARSPTQELSTGVQASVDAPVDDCASGSAVWFGAVVPKRHARRAVTRSLLKRQIRAAVSKQQETLACGLWGVRLRAPFDRKAFPRAASGALKCTALAELEQLFSAAARRSSRA